MTSPLARLEAILDEEHHAARRADVARLLQLQSDKAPLIEHVRKSAGAADVARVEAKAHVNIRLMRQLAGILREFARGADERAYSRSGTIPPLSGGKSRGVL